MLRRTSLKLGTAWGVSLAIHVALVAVAALVAVRVALEPKAGPERYIDFDDAGAEPALEASPRDARANAGASMATSPAAPSLEAEAADVPAVEAPAPAASSDEESTSSGPATDAWLAPAPLTAKSASKSNSADLSAAPRGGEVRFAGLGSSNARSVVYVVDASGPMVSSLREVIDELDRSVSRLSATQRFGVVVFRRIKGGEAESFMPMLVRATPKAKKEMRDWLMGLAPSGKSNPLSGLRMALEMRPDAVFLLSRGIERSGGGVWELGLDSTMEELDRLNPVDTRVGRRAVVIKTIQFIDEDPTGTMQRIGQVHGESMSPTGKVQPGYRVVKRSSELTDEPPAAGLEP